MEEIYKRLPKDAHILQIKEKWGGLRFYVDADMETLHFIDEMEEKSLTVCERCGEFGKLRRGGWVLTLCDKCNESRL